MFKRTKAKNFERNIGLQILRVLLHFKLCFWVLIFHFIRKTNSFTLNFILHKKFHVPCFFFISFYYLFPIIRDRNSDKMKIRLKRLFVPYIIWPVFIWCFNNLLYLIFEKNRFGRILSFKELKLQLITGRMFLIQFWYLFNLLFLSILFFIIYIVNRYIFFIFIYLNFILCFFIQYYDYNYIYTTFKDSIAFSVGHFIISFPLAVTAFSFNTNNKIIQYLEIGRYIFLILILIILFFLFTYGTPNTYYGMDKILFSLFTFYWFYLLPFKEYLSKNSKTIIYLFIVSLI